jgi:hypothetical protein
MALTPQQLVKKFGPAKLINREREAELIQQGKSKHILALLGTDVGYDDLNPSDRPDDEELEDMGIEKEDYTQHVYSAAVGHHIVNVSELYEMTKPMPPNLKMVEDSDADWFGDDALPAP